MFATRTPHDFCRGCIPGKESNGCAFGGGDKPFRSNLPRGTFISVRTHVQRQRRSAAHKAYNDAIVRCEIYNGGGAGRGVQSADVLLTEH